MSRKPKSIYQGRIVDLRIERHRLRNGSFHDYEIVRHAPAAAVLPVRANQLLLVRQFRTPFKKRIWEIPAGLIDHGETALQCARRELIEETGYRGRNFRRVGAIMPSPGFCDEVITLYQCDVGKYVGDDLGLTEDLSVHLLPITKVKQMLARGIIQDAKTIVALQQFFLKPNT